MVNFIIKIYLYMNASTFISTLRDKYTKPETKYTPLHCKIKQAEKPVKVTPGKIRKIKSTNNS